MELVTEMEDYGFRNEPWNTVWLFINDNSKAVLFYHCFRNFLDFSRGLKETW
jgi:hypothetical protein